jgi:hypothetical protein
LEGGAKLVQIRRSPAGKKKLVQKLEKLVQMGDFVRTRLYGGGVNFIDLLKIIPNITHVFFRKIFL